MNGAPGYAYAGPAGNCIAREPRQTEARNEEKKESVKNFYALYYRIIRSIKNFQHFC